MINWNKNNNFLLLKAVIKASDKNKSRGIVFTLKKKSNFGTQWSIQVAVKVET